MGADAGGGEMALWTCQDHRKNLHSGHEAVRSCRILVAKRATRRASQHARGWRRLPVRLQLLIESASFLGLIHPATVTFYWSCLRTSPTSRRWKTLGRSSLRHTVVTCLQCCRTRGAAAARASS